jgi:hypothetical protein
VDGVVFVADCAADRQAENRESLESLAAFLKSYGQSLSSIPVVFQFNKSDLPGALDAGEMQRALNPAGLPSFKASSQSGEGVLQTLLGLVKTVLAGLRDKGLEGIGSGEGLQRIVEPPAAEPPSAAQTSAQADAPSAPLAAVETDSARLWQSLTPEASLSLESAALEAHAAADRAAEARVGEGRGQARPAPTVAGAGGTGEEPLTLEIAGAAYPAESGALRLPLTIRCGERTRSVVLTVALSLEEE